jgi:hypothetical protein
MVQVALCMERDGQALPKVDGMPVVVGLFCS